MHKFFISLLIVLLSGLAQAQSNIDQWKNSEKTYKDLIDDGFEIKSYNVTSINTIEDLTILLFITVLQKNKEVFECQEYQTLDKDMNTLDMSLVCRELTQPYQKGIET